jgi:hypothetical protein
VLGAGEKDQATSGDDSGTGIAPGSEGKNPRSYTHRGLAYINRWRISPAGYYLLIPVSGVPRLAAEGI